MNLLHILPRLPAPPNDGGAVYVYHMLKELAALGHNLTIASLISNKHEQDADATREFATLYAADGQYRPYNLRSVIRSSVTREPITIQHRMNREIMRSLLSQVTKTPDVILLEGLHTAAFMEDVKKRFPGVPVVLRQVNVEYLLLERNGKLSRNPAKRWFFLDQSRLMKRFELEAMKNADYLTAISEADAALYKEDLPDLKVFINTAGAHLPPESSEPRDENMLLAISNWRWQPNFDGLSWFMDTVWPGLQQNHPDLHFHIAGEGLPESFKKTHASPMVHFLGFVDDLTKLRSKATVFVAPLLSGSGMKLKILEGLAAGLPTVTTRYGAEGIDMIHRKHYLHADTALETITSATNLFQNPDLRGHLSENGRTLIQEEYSWEQKARELTGFLERVVNTSNPIQDSD
jgi:glycosyltransferase involved in cell wall biosynthesis